MFFSPQTLSNKLLGFRFQAMRGFTLMELLISISIFLIITAMVIVNFHSGRYRDELVGAAEAITTSIREMQTATNAGDVVECIPPNSEPPANGFGVSLALSSDALLFADCPGTATFIYDVNDVDVKTINWSLRAPVSSIEIDSNPAPGGTLDILFSAGSEKVRLNGSNEKEVAVITLTHEKTGRQAVVRINAITGQVFITYL